LPAIGFVSPKGGAGKTTAALSLALALADRGWKVAMIDGDPNKPLVHWASLPGSAGQVSVHAAPTAQDVPAALREAQRRTPDWIVLDTEGSVRGALSFRAMRLDLVITPLAASQIEAIQAIKAAELVGSQGSGSGPLHRCLITRLPAAIRPRSLKIVVEQLKNKGVELLPTALIEKEAFRMLFAVGGDFTTLEREGITGAASARQNASALLDAVLTLLGPRAPAPPQPS
jgi:chromosome partitioning protein